jgi:adenylate cyclase class 2
MKKEVELQIIIKNPIEVEKKLRKVGKFVGARRQVDKYFVPPYRDFFKKEPPIEYLRVRFEKGKNHLNYSFLHFGKDRWLKATDEYETFVEKPEIVEEIFKKIGLIPKVTVIKTRKYFDCINFEVTLDKVKGLGNFMEIEAKKSFGSIEKTRKACLDFLSKLNIKYEMRAQMGYPRMVYRKLKYGETIGQNI